MSLSPSESTVSGLFESINDC